MTKLIAKSGHGRNRLREHGSEWILTNDHLAHSPVPAARVFQSVKTGAKRWINLNSDPDFTVEKTND